MVLVAIHAIRPPASAAASLAPSLPGGVVLPARWKPPPNAVPGFDGVDLPQWVRAVVHEEWTAEVFDASIADEAHAEEEMMRLLKLAVECTEQRPERRPTMAEVAARIEHIVDTVIRNADVDDFDSVSQ